VIQTSPPGLASPESTSHGMNADGQIAHELTLSELAARYGLDDSYYDYRGQLKPFSDAARSAIVAAMTAGKGAAVPAPRTVWVATQAESFIELPSCTAEHALLRIVLESGDIRSLQVTLQQTSSGTVKRLPLPATLPLGYHQLLVSARDFIATGALIITPARCYEPPSMQQDSRYWGLSIQLYTLRTDHNFGIGDFADLQALIRDTASLGCATIGLNPLHALRPADAAHLSPYSPSNREFLNVLYVAPALMPEFGSTVARHFMAKHGAALPALRYAQVVDYVAVAKLKLSLLRILFAEFKKSSTRYQAFRNYAAEQGESLQLHALYDALDAHFAAHPGRHWGWRSWPEQFHDPRSAAVKAFAEHHADEVEFYLYLQWLAATQLQECQNLARQCGMQLGLYGDVAVGVDPNGSEVWGQRSLYLDSISVGAPPDPLALKGQDWGIPPQHPLELTALAYQPFIRMLRTNMRSCGALRIDHVMTLCRLWWVPRGFEATDGVYVRYPLDDLIKLVALESVRNECLVIGEDLGTVPDLMREAMHRFGLYHYKVLFFEKTRDGHFIAPHDYVANALAVVTTHDLPTFKSWWQSDDITLRITLNLYPDQATLEQVQREREQDRRELMQALRTEGLWGWQSHEPLPPYSFALMRAAYMYAGLSRARLLVIQPEDLQGMIDPVNVPGTSTEHPNWQRKVDEDIGKTLQHSEVIEMLNAMNKARRGEFPNR
jgi:4-alpha-glucanotransferase